MTIINRNKTKFQTTFQRPLPRCKQLILIFNYNLVVEFESLGMRVAKYSLLKTFFPSSNGRSSTTLNDFNTNTFFIVFSLFLVRFREEIFSVFFCHESYADITIGIGTCNSLQTLEVFQTDSSHKLFEARWILNAGYDSAPINSRFFFLKHLTILTNYNEIALTIL